MLSDMKLGIVGLTAKWCKSTLFNAIPNAAR
jgi:ribosome-binding ATPase YchF (GTP1/OBG family)